MHESLLSKSISVHSDQLKVRKAGLPHFLPWYFAPIGIFMLDCYSSMIEKILSQDELLGMRQTLRAAGKTLVFTNGVFDLLHVGHVRYLAAARALGDALVVAVNSDRTVRELKGDGRPVINESERAEILAALRQVDYVTIFDDVSPRHLIARLLPDVLVKGGDYRLDEIHGREEVEAAGGTVISLPFVEGLSTSNILERMKEAGK
jgi:D-beta-D-heptose 7-phosphate kinase/D-beta-D-heptose 1-phosphate adenosyltransferase